MMAIISAYKDKEYSNDSHLPGDKTLQDFFCHQFDFELYPEHFRRVSLQNGREFQRLFLRLRFLYHDFRICIWYVI